MSITPSVPAAPGTRPASRRRKPLTPDCTRTSPAASAAGCSVPSWPRSGCSSRARASSLRNRLRACSAAKRLSSSLFPSASGTRPGCTRSTRNRSTPRMRRVSSRPGRRASISSTGLATATSGRPASVANTASSKPSRGPTSCRSASPATSRMPRPNSSSAAPWMSWTASPSATPSAIATSDSAVASRRRRRLARKMRRSGGFMPAP